jgi:hypothetical protein
MEKVQNLKSSNAAPSSKIFRDKLYCIETQSINNNRTNCIVLKHRVLTIEQFVLSLI